MWNQLKQMGRRAMKWMGLINELESVQDHKQINVNEENYNRIDLNKRLYQGYVKEWHDLEYKSSTGRDIQRQQKSMNMPKHLAKKMARLILNEKMKISIAEDSSKEDEWAKVQDVFNSNKFIRELQRYIEYMFAMGGVAIEIYKDGNEPKLAYATADAFFPLSNDAEQVDEAVIVNQFKKGEYYYTLLKWHEWGEWGEHNYRIKNELYESKDNAKLGDLVPLSTLYEDMEEDNFFTREKPLFVYLKPNEANNKDIASPLGVSVFENAYDTLQMLDVMYDFWYNEFRLGKRRVAVPEHLVRTRTDENGRNHIVFDDSEELFVAMNSQEMESMEMKDLTIELRAEQVIESIQALLDILSMQVGLSAGTFTFTSQGMKTATQVVSENSETFQTRSSHINSIEDGIRDLVVAVYEVVTLDENVAEPLERMDISIDFNDGVFNDKESLRSFWSANFKDKLAPHKEAIKRIHDLSDEEAQAWVDEIHAENQREVVNRQQAIAQAELGVET